MRRIGWRFPGLPLVAALAPPAVPELVATVSRTAESVVSRTARAAGLTRRGVWSRPGRHHIEVHGVASTAASGSPGRSRRRWSGCPGCAWARVNAPSGRVVVAVEDPEPELR